MELNEKYVMKHGIIDKIELEITKLGVLDCVVHVVSIVPNKVHMDVFCRSEGDDDALDLENELL